MMKIRPYKDKDWNSVKDIYNISKPDECRGSVDLRAIIPLENDENFLKLFRESEIIVMEVKNKVIGFAGNKGNYISWMFVDPEHRRKGVAGKLLSEILKDLKGEIKLNVAKNNIAGKKLYKKFGFVIEKEFVGNFNGYKSQAMILVLNK
ncbi:GNAT family N-acetyltransferase [Thermodesulfobacteriota bacterium]